MLISNTSTLVLLAKVGCLEKFIELPVKILIPKQVEIEALFHEESYYAKFIKKLIENKNIKILDVNNSKINNIMEQFRLDNGEAAAYVLFDARKHKAILTDDGELIKLCKLEKIPFICAMAVVIRLYEEKRISKEETLDKLEKLNKVGRYSKEIYEYFKNQII